MNSSIDNFVGTPDPSSVDDQLQRSSIEIVLKPTNAKELPIEPVSEEVDADTMDLDLQYRNFLEEKLELKLKERSFYFTTMLIQEPKFR